MGSGGRRHGARPARHPDGEEPPKATRPPPPPKGLRAKERRAWVELAGQVARARTYNPSRFTAFRIAVKAVAAMDEAPPGKLKGVLELASKLVARFGLDPVSVLQAERAPKPERPDKDDPLADL